MTTKESGGAPEAHSPRSHDPGGDDISLLQLLSVVLKHRYLIAGITLTIAFGVGVVGIQRPRTYTASGIFVTQGVERSLGSAAALAGQLGINLPTGGSVTDSPQFYADLLLSREILGRLLADTTLLEGADLGDTDSRPRTLLEFLRADGGQGQPGAAEVE